MEPCDFALHKAREEITRGHLSAIEVVKSSLDRIDAVDPRINAFITRTPDLALSTARKADTLRLRGKDPGPLLGLPVGLKDIFLTKDIRTTCGSRILENFIPAYNATATSKILDAQGALVGKLNMDEFAMGSSNENSFFGPTRNPWDQSRVPGGSSGGSAAAVAGGMTTVALGTDTGGSIRQPASLCGVCGIKPTYGRVSRYGIIAFASSLDQVGPIAHDVYDCALLLNILAGKDPNDATSAHVSVRDHIAHLEDGVHGMVLGVPDEYFAQGIDPEVERLVRKAIYEYQSLGAHIESISLPHTEYALCVYYIIAPAEASSNLARYDGVRYGLRLGDKYGLQDMYFMTRGKGFGREVKRRIMLGTYVLSAGYYEAYYRKAMQVRTLIRQDFLKAFEHLDAILCPTSPYTAFCIGEKLDDPLAMYLSDVYTIPANLAGLPALSLPCGFTQERLPVGLQVIGKPFDEPTVLRVGRAYEREHNWDKQRPRV